jgi:ABC-2 type transport system ATP-binding protein
MQRCLAASPASAFRGVADSALAGLATKRRGDHGMLLRTEKLTKIYKSFRALDGLTLEIGAGEVFGLLGPNGSGKTTALRLLLGFLQPSEGRALIADHDCWHDSVNARRHVAYLPGELRLYENMTGRQLVKFLCDLRGQSVHAELDDLAHRFDIDLTRPIANLSSGMKRKVALLTVFAPQTPLIIMDEPTNTLDPTMRDELLGLVKRAKERGQTVLFSSHVLAEAEQVCDRVAILQRGKLAHVQNMSELQEGRLVRARFQQEAVAPPALPGLRVMEQAKDRLTLEFTGELPELLSWLARQPLVELRVEPLGLTPLYYRYHGGVA